MMEDFGDYPSDNNSFEIISESPLKIRLSATTYDNDSTDIKYNLAKHSLVYGVLRTFINTNNNDVTVVSYLINNDNHQKFKDSPEHTTSLTKDQTFTITHKYIPYQFIK